MRISIYIYKGCETMVRTLRDILGMVAKSKNVKNKEQWVESILKHCEIDSDYLKFVNLRSNCNMWFGVNDAQFSCQPFILFRQFNNNENKKEFKEFEIYTFDSLKDETFKISVLGSFDSYYDSIEDFRLFYDCREVDFKIVLTSGKHAKLGEYNNLHEGFEFITDIYEIRLGADHSFYCDSEDMLKFELARLNGYGIVDEDKTTDECRYYKLNEIMVFRSGKEVEFELYKDKNGYGVNLI